MKYRSWVPEAVIAAAFAELIFAAVCIPAAFSLFFQFPCKAKQEGLAV